MQKKTYKNLKTSSPCRNCTRICTRNCARTAIMLIMPLDHENKISVALNTCTFCNLRKWWCDKRWLPFKLLETFTNVFTNITIILHTLSLPHLSFNVYKTSFVGKALMTLSPEYGRKSINICVESGKEDFSRNDELFTRFYPSKLSFGFTPRLTGSLPICCGTFMITKIKKGFQGPVTFLDMASLGLSTRGTHSRSQPSL